MAGIRTSRGRPYRKNDQAFVEQRNASVVRRWVGYDRSRSKAAFSLLHRLYAALRPYVNCFQAVQKLVHKQREGAKVPTFGLRCVPHALPASPGLWSALPTAGSPLDGAVSSPQPRRPAARDRGLLRRPAAAYRPEQAAPAW